MTLRHLPTSQKEAQLGAVAWMPLARDWEQSRHENDHGDESDACQNRDRQGSRRREWVGRLVAARGAKEEKSSRQVGKRSCRNRERETEHRRAGADGDG